MTFRVFMNAQYGAAFLAILFLIGCAGTPPTREFGGPVGRGDRLYAQSIEMTAPENWARRAALATFVPGVVEAGVESVEFQLGYGETTVAWNFGGFRAGQSVLISHDVNIDLFGTDTAVRYAYLSGRVTAEDAFDPRDEINAAIRHRWSDGDPVRPDTTGGWITISETVQAGPDGMVSLLLIIGRAADNPPIVFGHFTNPVATGMD